MNYKERGMGKKGISGVIAAVIMIALVMAAVIIVWSVVIPLIKNQLTETESCFGIFGKVTINNMYTCHNSSSNNFQFSINIGDIDVDEVVVTNHEKDPEDISVCRELEELRPAIFANGGDRKADNIPEYRLCNKLDIEMVFNIGGGKIQSSSELVSTYHKD